MRISDWSSDVCSSDLRDPLRHQSHRSEDEGERNGREDLEDALDPQMDDPPAPILHDRDVRALAIEKTRAIEEADGDGRSEEHTSELQSLMRISYAVFCLKKKNNNTIITHNKHTHQYT